MPILKYQWPSSRLDSDLMRKVKAISMTRKQSVAEVIADLARQGCEEYYCPEHPEHTEFWSHLTKLEQQER